MNMGWTCPKCGGVFSPTTPQCFNCKGGGYTTTYPTTTGPLEPLGPSITWTGPSTTWTAMNQPSGEVLC